MPNTCHKTKRCQHATIVSNVRWHFLERKTMFNFRPRIPSTLHLRLVNSRMQYVEIPIILIHCKNFVCSREFIQSKIYSKLITYICKYIRMTSYSGLSTLTKYHDEGMGLHEFFHHSGIVSCITFHMKLLSSFHFFI